MTKRSKSYYVLYLLLFAVGLFSFGQEVDENFDGYTGPTGFNSFLYNNFDITNGRIVGPSTNRYVWLDSRTTTSSSILEYVGSDGNGKDGGVGRISFDYKFRIVSSDVYIVRVSINGGPYEVKGDAIQLNNPNIYKEWFFDLDSPSDNIKVRVLRTTASSGSYPALLIDNFKITDFSNTCTWDGTSWSPTPPTLSETAIINGDYNTSFGGPNHQESFSARNLIVNSPHELTIADGDYVEVQNNITAEGNITVKSSGALVQNNDSGTVLGSGTMKVEKVTSALASADEYTYWSSPVNGFTATISNNLSRANPNRVYKFLGENFIDEYAETNNDDVNGIGHDDINDGPNPDWVYVSGSTEMEKGVGYAATHSQSAFAASSTNPKTITYGFEGIFNYGNIPVTIYRNDLELDDNNWNFIGNPYPSAISVDAFFSKNVYDLSTNPSGAIDGALYLWSHNSSLSTNNNGNDTSNFSQNDYAIINGTGTVEAGGDGVTPNRFIPSGQGFFISMSDSVLPCTDLGGGIKSADVTFNNSMRVTGDNDQFFRTSIEGQPNKLWVNLTSDNGVFNQLLVGYVEGATDQFDGAYYDAPRNLSSANNASIYTWIPSTPDKKLAIQGRNPSSLNTAEVINLGFKNAIDVPTLYTFSIFKTEGAFITENPVYLKDNLLGTTHNLSANDYTFSSEVGEFNSRFEIVFTPDEALSTKDELLNPNALSITELSNGEVAFEVGKNFSIANIAIFDLLGRQIYQLQGANSREVYNLEKLGNTPYIAKVTLTNGQVLSKKAIKQH